MLPSQWIYTAVLQWKAEFVTGWQYIAIIINIAAVVVKFTQI